MHGRGEKRGGCDRGCFLFFARQNVFAWVVARQCPCSWCRPGTWRGMAVEKTGRDSVWSREGGRSEVRLSPLDSPRLTEEDRCSGCNSLPRLRTRRTSKSNPQAAGCAGPAPSPVVLLSRGRRHCVRRRFVRAVSVILTRLNSRRWWREPSKGCRDPQWHQGTARKDAGHPFAAQQRTRLRREYNPPRAACRQRAASVGESVTTLPSQSSAMDASSSSRFPRCGHIFATSSNGSASCRVCLKADNVWQSAPSSTATLSSPNEAVICIVAAAAGVLSKRGYGGTQRNGQRA